MTKWRAELESCGAGSCGSGCWTLPVPEFFPETRITHFTKVKSDFTLVKRSTLLEGGEEYKEERNTYSRAGARDNGPLGNKKLRAKAHATKRRMQRLHWDNCKVRFDEAVVFSFAVSALAAGLSGVRRHHCLRPRLAPKSWPGNRLPGYLGHRIHSQ